MTAYSFEFFPPKSEKAEANLWQVVDRLSGLNPDFVSITYGAGGSTRERTHACVKKLSQETELTPAAHLTCVSASKAEVDAVIDSYKEVGVNHIVALRVICPIWAHLCRTLTGIKVRLSWSPRLPSGVGLKSQ